MSSLQIDPSGNFHICFRFQGQRFKRSLKTKSEKKASTSLAKFDERIWMIANGHLSVPTDSELAEFLIHGAQAINKPKTVPGLSKPPVRKKVVANGCRRAFTGAWIETQNSDRKSNTSMQFAFSSMLLTFPNTNNAIASHDDVIENIDPDRFTNIGDTDAALAAIQLVTSAPSYVVHRQILQSLPLLRGEIHYWTCPRSLVPPFLSSVSPLLSSVKNLWVDELQTLVDFGSFIERATATITTVANQYH